MLAYPKFSERLDRLTEQVRSAPALDRELFVGVVADACTRLPQLGKSAKATRIDRLIDAGAWNEAALALIELELPGWTLRRLVYEDGEWLCSLSEEPRLPLVLDDVADARHEVLPLAILAAFLEARRRVSAARETGSPAVPQVRPIADGALCCDNFA